VERAILACLLTPDAEFKAVDVNVTMQRPDPRRHRIAYPLVISGESRLIAPSIERATHVAVCDIEHSDPVRTKVMPFGEDRLGLLLDKRISKVYAFLPAKQEAQALQEEARQRLGQQADDGVIPIPLLAQSTCYLPAACGVVV
jgi:hypothetical protein